MSDKYDEAAKQLLDETIKRHGSICWPGTEYLAAALRRSADDERKACADLADEWGSEFGVCFQTTAQAEFYKYVTNFANSLREREETDDSNIDI